MVLIAEQPATPQKIEKLENGKLKVTYKSGDETAEVRCCASVPFMIVWVYLIGHRKSLTQ